MTTIYEDAEAVNPNRTVEESIEHLGLVAQSHEADAELIKARMARLGERKRSCERKATAARKWACCLLLFHQLKKVKTPVITVSLLKPRDRFVVHDMEQLPAEFKRIKEEPMMREIMNHYKETGEIPDGCDMEETEASVQIR